MEILCIQLATCRFENNHYVAWFVILFTNVIVMINIGVVLGWQVQLNEIFGWKCVSCNRRSKVPNLWTENQYLLSGQGGVRLEMRCTVSGRCLSQPKTIPHSYPWSMEKLSSTKPSLVLERLGTTVLEEFKCKNGHPNTSSFSNHHPTQWHTLWESGGCTTVLGTTFLSVKAFFPKPLPGACFCLGQPCHADWVWSHGDTFHRPRWGLGSRA